MKIGQKAKVIENNSGHGFRVGDIVVFIGMQGDFMIFQKEGKIADWGMLGMRGNEFEPIPLIDWDKLQRLYNSTEGSQQIFDWLKREIEKQLNP